MTTFRRRLGVEVAFGVVLVAVASALVQTSPGRTAANATSDEAAPTSEAFSTTIETPKLRLRVDLDPASTGNNSIHLYAFNRDGRPLTVVEWKAAASLTARGVDKVDIPVLPITANHAVGEVQLPTAGEWSFKFTARTSDVDQQTVERTIAIR